MVLLTMLPIPRHLPLHKRPFVVRAGNGEPLRHSEETTLSLSRCAALPSSQLLLEDQVFVQQGTIRVRQFVLL